jgi:hypothetical protein
MGNGITPSGCSRASRPIRIANSGTTCSRPMSGPITLCGRAIVTLSSTPARCHATAISSQAIFPPP